MMTMVPMFTRCPQAYSVRERVTFQKSGCSEGKGRTLVWIGTEISLSVRLCAGCHCSRLIAWSALFGISSRRSHWASVILHHSNKVFAFVFVMAHFLITSG